MTSLIFLKLGGSLITDKNTPSTARPEVIERLAGEIAGALDGRPDLRLIIGHGSGSFGHIAAKQYNTRGGVSTPEEWRGFAGVWREARALNQMVVERLEQAGLPVIAFPPSASVTAENGRVLLWDLSPLLSALDAGLIPLVNGDVVFDTRLGGTILSTEDVFAHLASHLNPQRILLAGIEEGVCEDYPTCKRLVREINHQNFFEVSHSLSGSAAPDVTGGMINKVTAMLELTREVPDLEVIIYCGETPDLTRRALNGETPGTVIRA